MSKQIIRITLFKIPSESDIEAALAKYSTLQGTAVKDGNPYILSVRAFKTYDDPRNNGFTVCGRTVFSSLEDMKYYDEDCDAHKELKAELKGKVAMPGGVMTVYMDGDAQMLGRAGTQMLMWNPIESNDIEEALRFEVMFK